MKGELPGSAQHGHLEAWPQFLCHLHSLHGLGAAPAPVPAQSEQESSAAARETAGEGRGR